MMSGFERNFSTYQLGDNVSELAGGLLPEMAEAMGTHIGRYPAQATLEGFIGYAAPEKELQKNVELTKSRLAGMGDADVITADWADRAGSLVAVERSFARPELEIPDDIDVAVITGGVGRWMERRVELLAEIAGRRGQRIGKVVFAAGNRVMNGSEHPQVKDYIDRFAGPPTEADYAATYSKPRLERAGLDVHGVAVRSAKGDDVMAKAVKEAGVGNVLVIANAPAAIQVAGAFRLAARGETPRFDEDGDQLYVASDSIDVARAGEGPATHQNPYTAIGQNIRNYLILQRNSA